MTDTLKFKALIVEKNYSQLKLSKELGISIQSLSLKINNVREFKVSEVSKIQKILGISDDRRDEIFFAKNVECKETEM